MSHDNNLATLLKLQKSNQHDGTAAEQVLKFFAYKNDRNNFRGAVTTFLNDFAEQASREFDYGTEGELFEVSVRFLAELLNGPFLRQSTAITPLVQFEACMIAIGEIFAEGKTPVEPEGDWINDEKLVAASTGGTNTRTMLTARISRAKEIFSGS